VSLIAAAGPKGGRSLLLGVHLDTVPAGDGWTRDPFGGELEDGRVYGRGATDIKGAAAAAIVAFRTLVEEGVTADARLILVLNADEEVGGRLGMDHVRDVLGEPVDAALIGEPSGIEESYERLWIAARGWLRFEITVEGTVTHTSMMRQPGVRSAVADMIAVLEGLRERLPLLEREHESGYREGELIVSQLEGGQGWGFVPPLARAKLELRVTPGIDFEGAVALISDAFADVRQATGATAHLTFPEGREWTSPSSIDADHALVGAATAAWSAVLGSEPQFGCIPGGTDARSLSERGIPSIPGIGPGTILRCHVRDEYVTVDELVTAARLYVLTVWGFLSGAAARQDGRNQ
jgi:acetylornithine deacetylase/succinyl-diaminopimelate desuccinylase-like protein